MKNIINKIEKSYPLISTNGNSSQKTLFFDIGNFNILPGQFYMVNFNGCQKPFSVSYYDGNKIGFTIQDRGECSKNIINAEVGSYFGLTGPLGNNFKITSNSKYLLIGGGIGTAPIYYLANYLKTKNIDFDLLFGARNIENVEYCNSMNPENNQKFLFYTDDGSYGKKGFLTDGLDELLKNKYDLCCICGPEKMMKIVLNKIENKIQNIEISMERYMKCGLGLCGSCVLDDVGLRVCEEGPVFSYKKILSFCREFGNYHRNGQGIIEN